MKPPRPRVNRRDLLRFRGAARERLADPIKAGDGDASPHDLLRAGRPGMGSFFEVRMGAATPGAIELAGRALDMVETLEAQLTVYRDDSEVSRLNATAHLGPVPVEPGLFALLQRAVALGDDTQGAYDVTAGALSEAWGFVKGPKRVPSDAELGDARAGLALGIFASIPGRCPWPSTDPVS